ncbi:TetR/AcrR family transcriptional regulator [Niallia taxi]|uniref:TetR/AcrR family transcriptional regulator n=1 Tax=Niallia taxi TaxID=2499688 RepID=UPI0011AA204F
MKKSKRTHILEVATDLFYRDGIHATGVDKIVAEAGVAKMTMYSHFPSKDDLILAYLDKRDTEWRTWFYESVNELAKEPIDKLIALFDVLDTWFNGPDFNGCAFLNTVAEFTGISHPFHEAALKHKEQLKDYIFDLVKATSITDSNEIAIADCLYLLVEGAIVTELMYQKGDSAKKAKVGAKLLLPINNK